jgi:hypothetical protein
MEQARLTPFQTPLLSTLLLARRLYLEDDFPLSGNCGMQRPNP